MTITGSCWPGCWPRPRVDATDADIAAVDTQIGEYLAPFADAAARLDEIPGIGPTAAAIIIAEIGLDMTRFPTPAHLASWAKFPPASTPPPARPKATAPPVTGTATSPASSARPRSKRAGPTPSSAPATDACSADEVRRKPSSQSAAHFW